MSIDNMLTAVEEVESETEFLAVLFAHLTAENGFYVKGVFPRPGVSAGLFAIDLNALSPDAIYVHLKGYARFRTLEEVVEFLCHFIPQEELEKVLRELKHGRVP